MAKVIIAGVEYPVEVTFGAITAYLESVGEDNADGMANFSKLPPSRYPAFIAACVNEALRKEGSEDRIDADMVADCDFIEVSNAVAVIFSLMIPQSSGDDKKKD